VLTEVARAALVWSSASRGMKVRPSRVSSMERIAASPGRRQFTEQLLHWQTDERNELHLVGERLEVLASIPPAGTPTVTG
jgi:hypothetical protein